MRTEQRVFLLATDLILVLASLLLALLVRFEGEIPSKYLEPNVVPYATLCAFSAGILWLFGLYNKLWRYLSIEEGIHLFNAVTVSFSCFAIPVFATGGTFYPRGVVVIAWLLALFLLGGVRLLLRLASFGLPLKHGARKVIVVGGGDAGEAVVRDLKRDPTSYWPVGILDEEEKNKNVRIHGVPILGKRADLPRVVQERGVRDVVITSPSPSVLKEILDLCKGLKVELKTIPGVQEFMNGKIKLSAVREIRIEDLLGREPIHISLDSLKSYLSRKSVLVTGAGGSIGSELCRQIAAFEPSELTLVGHGENSIYEIYLEISNRGCPVIPVVADIRDRERMSRVFEKARPDVIFHAAAHKHVPFMELQPFEAVSNNFLATCSLAEISRNAGVGKFVFLSTDKSVQPSSIMGTTKRLSEMFLQALEERLREQADRTQFISVRFGNVLDSRGSVVPTFRKQIAMGGPVTVTHGEMTRYFMTIPEAVQLVLQAAAIGNGGEIFLLDMGRPINILDLAHQMIRLAGYQPEKDIPVKITGPRPGEKLVERLSADHEVVKPTRFEKILEVRSSTKTFEEFQKSMVELDLLLDSENHDELMAWLVRMVPEYSGSAQGGIPRNANP